MYNNLFKTSDWLTQDWFKNHETEERTEQTQLFFLRRLQTIPAEGLLLLKTVETVALGALELVATANAVSSRNGSEAFSHALNSAKQFGTALLCTLVALPTLAIPYSAVAFLNFLDRNNCETASTMQGFEATKEMNGHFASLNFKELNRDDRIDLGKFFIDSSTLLDASELLAEMGILSSEEFLEVKETHQNFKELYFLWEFIHKASKNLNDGELALAKEDWEGHKDIIQKLIELNLLSPVDVQEFEAKLQSGDLDEGSDEPVTEEEPLPEPEPTSFIARARRVLFSPTEEMDFGSGRFGTLHRGLMWQAHHNARFRAAQNREAALNKLRKAGVEEAELEAVYESVVQLMQNSNPTLNFNADDMERLNRLKEREGLEKMWDAPEPKRIFGSGIVRKRERVEQRMHGFGGDDAKAQTRPTYMGLNLGGATQGAAPNYGGSYFIGKKDVFKRATISGGDSFNETFAESGFKVGTMEHPDAALANLEPSTLKKIIEIANGKTASPLPSNQYIEMQVLDMRWNDVEAVVLDRKEVPLGSEAERRWEEFANEKGLKVYFYDSKEFVRLAVSDLTKANQEQGPLPKEQDLPRSEANQARLDAAEIERRREQEALIVSSAKNFAHSFMQKLRLKKIPGQVSIGLKDLRTDISLFAATVNNPKAQKLPTDFVLQDLLETLRPYGANFKEKVAFAGKHKNIEVEGNLSFQILVEMPITHTRQYTVLIGNFRKAIDSGDPLAVIEQARQLADAEKLFCERIRQLKEVCETGKIKSKKRAKEIVHQCEAILEKAEITEKLFSDLHESVKSSPETWIKTLQVKEPSNGTLRRRRG